MGEKGSVGLGVLDRMGLPAKAWEFILMDMVERRRWEWVLAMVKDWRERVLERGDKLNNNNSSPYQNTLAQWFAVVD